MPRPARGTGRGDRHKRPLGGVNCNMGFGRVMDPTAPSDGILMTMHRLSQGGADRVGILLANSFVRAGIPTRLALLRSGGEGERALLDSLDTDVSISCAGRPMGSRHLELARGLRFIQREIASFKPSIVLASSSNMGLITGISARLQTGRGPRYAMKLTNPVVRPRDHGSLRTAYRHRLYGFIFASYDLVITLTEEELSDLSSIYRDGPFQTVPNPYISDEMLAEQPPPLRSEPPRILTMARMMPQKRLDVLIEAFALVKHSGARLTILGDGPLRASLERLADSLGIAGRIDMPGFVEDVLPWLRRSNLFVLSSDYEGLPAAVLEALACGVPVVTTDSFAGARAMFDAEESCAVVPIGNPAALARSIERCIGATRRPEGLRKIAERYGIEASATAHIAALEPLMDAR